MPGFNSYDAIINALTVSNKGQEIAFGKAFPIATVAGVIYSSWLFGGVTTAGTPAGAGGSSSAAFVSCNNLNVGAIPFVSPTTASAENPYLLSVGAMPTLSMGGTMMLIDRIADTGVLSTSSGTSCTFTMPGGGWARYNNGIGLKAFIESQAVAPTATAVVSLSYTNPDSTAGRIPAPATLTAVAYKAFGSGSNAPTGSPFFTLQGNDTGIKSIESLSMTTAAAANIALVVCKPLLMIPITTGMYYTERDLVIQTPKLPKLEVFSDASACLQWLYFPNAAVTNPTIMGSVSMVAG